MNRDKNAIMNADLWPDSVMILRYVMSFSSLGMAVNTLKYPLQLKLCTIKMHGSGNGLAMAQQLCLGCTYLIARNVVI